MEPAPGDMQLRNRADVQVVALPVAGAVEAEFAVFDDQFDRWIVGREDPVLVAQEPAAAHMQRASLQADPGAVLVTDGRIGELETLDGHSRAAHDPDGLAFGRLAAGRQAGDTAAGSKRQVVLLPDGNISDVVTRIDFDDRAVLGQQGGLCQCLDVPVLADLDELCGCPGLQAAG